MCESQKIYQYSYIFIQFRKLYSIHMALITLTDILSNALDDGSKVAGKFLDFSQAFDGHDSHDSQIPIGIAASGSLDW